MCRLLIGLRSAPSSNNFLIGLLPPPCPSLPSLLLLPVPRMLRRGFASASAPVRRQLLFYTYVADMATRRGAVRPLHLVHAEAAVRAGRLLAGGAYAPNTDGGLLVFDAGRDEVEAFARADPYVTSKLVTHWEVKEWVVVVGKAPGEA